MTRFRTPSLLVCLAQGHTESAGLVLHTRDQVPRYLEVLQEPVLALWSCVRVYLCKSPVQIEEGRAVARQRELLDEFPIRAGKVVSQ